MHHNLLHTPNQAVSWPCAGIWQHVGVPIHAASTTGSSLTLHRCCLDPVFRCHASFSQQQHVELLDREQRGLQFQLERAAARNFREGNYDRITQTVREQDLLFEAAHITSSFKALAVVEVPDDEAALQRREEFLTELCSLTEGTLSALHPAQLVTLLWSCGRLSHHPGQLLGQLSRQLEPHVHSLDTKQLTQVAWSLAKLGSIGSHEGALLDAVATAGIQQADQFTPLGMANLIWSFGRLHHPADALVGAIVPQAARSIDDFNAQCLCSLLYGLAVLQQPLGHDLKAVLPSAVANRVEEFTPQGLALSMWALSGLQTAGECHVDEHLLDRIAERAVVLAADFNPLDTCNLLVAFARLEYTEDVCVSAICSAAALQDQPFGRLETIGTLWSLGKLNARPPLLLPLLAARAEQLLLDMDIWEVGNVMTAFSRLQYTPESPSLLPALMKCAQDGVDRMSQQTLANVSTALARLPVQPQTRPLALAIAAEFCARNSSSGELPKPEEVVNLLSGQVRTNTADAALCDAAIAAAAAQLPAMELQHLSTLLFSLGKAALINEGVLLAQARYQARGAAFSSVLRRAVQQLEQHSGSGSTRQLATVLWGLARLSPGLDAISSALDSSLAARLHEFNARDIVFTAYACSRLQGSYVVLPHAIATEIESRGFNDFTLGEVAYIARGLATHKALTPSLQAALRRLMDTDSRIQRWQLVHLGKSLKMAKST